jgi:hypothetical protein
LPPEPAEGGAVPGPGSRRRSISATSLSGDVVTGPPAYAAAAQPQLHPTRHCIGRSIWRQLKPRGKRGNGSPSCATCTRPVRVPKMFSSSYAPVTGASSPGWSTVSMVSPMPRKRAFCMPVQRHAGIKRLSTKRSGKPDPRLPEQRIDRALTRRDARSRPRSTALPPREPSGPASAVRSSARSRLASDCHSSLRIQVTPIAEARTVKKAATAISLSNSRPRASGDCCQNGGSACFSRSLLRH